MAKLSVQAGSTGVSVNLFIQSATATDGSGMTGLKQNTASLTCYYIRQRTTATPITLATSTVGNGWVSGGFMEVDATNAKGIYDFGIPNAAIGTGSPFATVIFQGATGMAPLPLEIELTAWNNQDATGGGINNLSATGTLGSVSNVRGTATVILSTGVHTGAVIPVVQTASVALTANTVGTASGIPPVILSTGTHVGAVIPTVNAITTSNDGRMANLDAAVSSRSVYAGGAVAGVSGVTFPATVAAPGDAMALTGAERASLAVVIGTSSQVEAYRANGQGGSINQILYEILGNLVEANNSGTTRTVKKVDHTATAATYQYDSSAPNTITRAS